jgi:hypothetical protein
MPHSRISHSVQWWNLIPSVVQPVQWMLSGLMLDLYISDHF